MPSSCLRTAGVLAQSHTVARRLRRFCVAVSRSRSAPTTFAGRPPREWPRPASRVITSQRCSITLMGGRPQRGSTIATHTTKKSATRSNAGRSGYRPSSKARVLVAFDRATLPWHAGQVLRAGESHGGLILFRGTVRGTNYGDQARLLTEFWLETSVPIWQVRFDFALPAAPRIGVWVLGSKRTHLLDDFLESVSGTAVIVPVPHWGPVYCRPPRTAHPTA